MTEEAEQNQGGPMVYQIVTRAREWAEENAWRGGGGREGGQEGDDGEGKGEGEGGKEGEKESEAMSVLLQEYEGGEEELVREATRAAA
eukprot:2270696-Rhodomonas_salina.1